MKNRIRAFLSNQWTIGIATGFISSLIFYYVLRLADSNKGSSIINTIWGYICFIPNLFTARYNLPLFALILLFLSGIAIFFLITWIIISKKTIENNSPDWLPYTEDTFDGIIYRWEYGLNRNNKYEILKIQPHCPKCKCSILVNKCPNCKQIYDSGFLHLANNRNMPKIKSSEEIETLIKYKINEGKYKNNHIHR